YSSALSRWLVHLLCILSIFICSFFFSSRRRHTRFKCDWSSDVCSSDLRAATGRDAVVKFAGAYHGHVDGLLAEAGSGLATQGIPASPGVTAAQAADTIVVPWNDRDAVAAALRARPVAALICEPFPANMGLVKPEPGFLSFLREVASEAGALLIFDEVMTGFRASPGGVQQPAAVPPELQLLGQVRGGGLAAAAT